MFLLSIIYLLPQLTFGQKSIVLKSTSKSDMQIYNLNGAEIYISINDSNYFVPKKAPFKFETTTTIDSLIKNSKLKEVSILIRNMKYEFVITLNAAIYLKQHSFEMYVYTQNKKQGYIIGLTETHGWGTNSQILSIKPNKLWKPKYYKSQ